MNEENIEETTFDNHGYKEEIEYAGFWIRFGAALIDVLVMIPIIAISTYNQFEMKSIVLLYALTVLSALYKPLMEFKYGATLGKMACKIKVVNEDLNPITIDQGFGRYIPWGISVVLQLMAASYIFSDPGFNSADTYMEIGLIAQNSPIANISNIYNIVFLVIIGSLIFDKKSRGFHDKIAKTTVIKVKK
ncbi:MAG: RDD family protein [Vicingaceae bacterium]|nr:RDD family protein [Vicingaceae bacterium]